ncbi:MAG: hypothetical protein ABJA67_04530 [Chthonomonadales bacterium]
MEYIDERPSPMGDMPPQKRLAIPNIILTIAAIIFLIIHFLPPTNWMSANYLRLQVVADSANDIDRNSEESRSQPSRKVSSAEANRARYALEHPGDLGVQIANIVIPQVYNSNSNKGASATDRLLQLDGKFPNSPEYYATTLRLMCTGLIRINRPEADPGQAWSNQAAVMSEADKKKQVDGSMKALELADRWAKLEPENGVPHIYRTTALLSLSRDEEAFHALHQAALSLQYDEHMKFETDSRIKLLELTEGRLTIIQKASDGYNIMFPHYAQWRSMTRTMGGLAGNLEKSGSAAKGIQIRKDMLSVASMIRADSLTLIGVLVGVAMGSLSTTYLNGEIPPKNSNVPATTRTVARGHKYIAFLKAHGETKEPIRYQREANAGISARTIVTTYMNRVQFGPFDMRRLIILQAIACIVLGNLIWCVIGISFLALMHWRRESRLKNHLRPDDIFTYAFGIAMVCLLGSVLFNGQSKMVYSLVSTWAMIGMGNTVPGSEQLWRIVCFVLCLGLPALVLFASIIWAAIRRRKFGNTFFATARASFAVLCLVLVIGYAVVLNLGNREDVVATQIWKQAMTNEPLFAARKVALPWPPRMMPE